MNRHRVFLVLLLLAASTSNAQLTPPFKHQALAVLSDLKTIYGRNPAIDSPMVDRLVTRIEIAESLQKSSTDSLVYEQLTKARDDLIAYLYANQLVAASGCIQAKCATVVSEARADYDRSYNQVARSLRGR